MLPITLGLMIATFASLLLFVLCFAMDRKFFGILAMVCFFGCFVGTMATGEAHNAKVAAAVDRCMLEVASQPNWADMSPAQIRAAAEEANSTEFKVVTDRCYDRVVSASLEPAN